MKRVDLDELTLKLNQFRDQNKKKTYTSEELIDILHGIGFQRTAASAIAQKAFNYELMDGRKRLYEVPEEPIHKNIVIGVYNKISSYNNTRKKNKPTITVVNDSKEMTPMKKQQEAWDVLVAAGVIKTKFNLNTLKTKYPKVYLDCLEYEIVK